jgi:hypothetical protein
MTAQKTFSFVKAFVNLVFYLFLIIGLGILTLKTYFLLQGSRTVADVPTLSTVGFDVTSFNGSSKTGHYELSHSGAVSVETDQSLYSMRIAPRSVLGYYAYGVIVVTVLAALYGMWLLRRIFYSITLQHPFEPRNAARIATIGWLFVLADLFRLLHYFVFNRLAATYFPGRTFQLVTDFGGGIFFGLIIVALSQVYRRGTEIHVEYKPK